MDHIEECGMTEMPAMAPPAPEMDKGNPVTVSVSMNASGKEHVADLLDMMKNAGLGGAEEVAPKMLAPRDDMERLSAMMDEPKEEQIEEGGTKAVIDMIANAEDPTQMVMDLIAKGGVEGKFLYGELEQLAVEAGKTFNDGETDPEEMVPELLANMGIEEGIQEEDYANEPDPQYGDMSDAIPDGNDLNRKKKSYPATQDGDNPMAVEAIKAALYAALTEKKDSAGIDAMKKAGNAKADAEAKERSKKKTMVKGPDGKMVPDYAADGKGKDDLKKDIKTTEGRGRGKKKTKEEMTAEGRGKVMAGRGRGKVMAGRGRGKDKLMAGRGRGKKK